MKQLLSMDIDASDFLKNENIEKIASTDITIEDVNIETQYKDTDFGLVLSHPGCEPVRKFAFYNKAITEANLQCLADQENILPDEIVKTAAMNLSCAAKRYGLDLPPTLEKYASDTFVDRKVNVKSIKYASYIKKLEEAKENTEGVYALGDKYPIHTKDHLEKAAEWFGRNYTKMPIDDIRQFVTNVIKQASVLNTNLEGSEITKFASLHPKEFNENLYNHISIRKGKLGDTPDSEDYKHLYNDALSRADEIGALKLAYLIEVLDKESGLDSYYESGVLDPLRSCLADRAAPKIVKVGNSSITLEDLQNLSPEVLTETVGAGIAQELKSEEGVAIFESLPTPIKEQIMEHI